MRLHDLLNPTAALSARRKAACRRLTASGNPFDPDDPDRTDRLDEEDFAPGHDKT